MSIHKECGEKIHWAKSEKKDHGRGGRWMPPLEFVSHYYVIQKDEESGDEFASMVACYDVHVCDPDKMAAWTEYKSRIDKAVEAEKDAASERPPTNWELARSRDQEEARGKAERVACPKCSAEINEPCYNLITFKRHGYKAANNMPHEGRTLLAYGDIKE